MAASAVADISSSTGWEAVPSPVAAADCCRDGGNIAGAAGFPAASTGQQTTSLEVLLTTGQKTAAPTMTL